MTKKDKRLTEKGNVVTERLKEHYSSECALLYQGEAWKLLVLARLSAQCTDKRVNIVSIPLFNEFPTLKSMAECDIARLEEIIKPCGLYHMKAKDIKSSCQALVSDFGGVVPNNMDDLLSLSGVGRKIANLLLGDIYKMPAIVADTHCIRIASRLGFTDKDEKSPLKTENTLKKYIKEDEQSDFCHRIVQFGREICMARSPRCNDCFLSDVCENGRKI
ncbi:MAG: endonuclease III [Clostridia bacterium]|nr:endonuclease III [Clostridia bacterium]